MSLEHKEKGLSKATYSDKDHLFYMYLEGDTEPRGDIILTHPDIISFVYCHDDTVVKSYLPKNVVHFKVTHIEKR